MFSVHMAYELSRQHQKALLDWAERERLAQLAKRPTSSLRERVLHGLLRIPQVPIARINCPDMPENGTCCAPAA